jgi:hypothetical protein
MEGKGAGRRRLSVTTEAKRRTSLEDDDDEEDEVVQVKMAEADVEAAKGVGSDSVGGSMGGAVGGGDDGDGELVEIQHAETMGVESGGN